MADLATFIDQPLIDPTLHRLSRDVSSTPIDPALFELEGLVNDVRKGKIKLDDVDEPEHAGVDDDDIDPALRAIVNSLTNAQQSSTSSPGPSLTQAQAVAAVSAHIAEHEDPDRLQQSLEEITSATFGSLFPPTFPTSPTPFTLPQPIDDPSTHAEPAAETASAVPAPPVKRGQGRPKGSKNKPKPNAIPKPPKPKPPPKKRGRPRKIKTEEEIAAEQAARQAKRRESRGQGKKGRPRKFPGFLVREMRLKKHKAEYRELIRRAEEGLPFDGIEIKRDTPQDGEQHDGEYDPTLEGEYGEEGEGHEEVQGAGDNLYQWQADDRDLLEVVGAAQQMDEDVEGQEQSEQSMREVFGLDVAGVGS